MSEFSFHQVDVFTTQPMAGNPLAVVVGADGLSERQMAAFANWTNLSETTFLLRPEDERADYRVRIFTPRGELPFAGHPTLGSCHVWLASGGVPKGDREIVQECAVGPVRIRREDDRLFFAAPPLRRSGAVAADVVAHAVAALRLPPAAVAASNWVDNGPGWLGLLLRSRAQVLAVTPDYAALDDLKIGIAGPWDPARDGDDAQYEVRAFYPPAVEDPVTGSLNAGLAQWLIGAGIAPARYVASQGTALGRQGRVHVAQDGADIWIGGHVAPCIRGTVVL
ncbi:PhzF family phenazine biosynthesis protein [Pseudochelatococcus lubricantis]|uniref:PhzF family phenazine biosynthesis protein n=1 Tax=Pseudochelatococcus lubricantis TaxID=1538102 RepID=UPI0035F06CE0